ncbi:MAG: HutD family protein [Hyphomicrobiaceae bacterium]
MSIRHFPSQGYVRMSWKNGRGSTDEICLMPPGASRDAFDLRISRASIPEPGPFSAFPGVERTITVIDGAGLKLDFGDQVATLTARQPYTFDSGLAPLGIPKGGPVRVVNVMAARAVWRIAPAAVVTETASLDAVLSVVFAIDGNWLLDDGPNRTTLVRGDTALSEGPGSLAPQSAGAVLVVPLIPA